MRIVDQLPILNGEYIHFIGPSGKQNEDILLATNFRIFLLTHESTSFINVPTMLVESIEIKEILFLYVYLKNAKTIRLSFSSSEKSNLWYQRLNSIILKPIKLEELFAFTFYSWLTNEKSEEAVFADSELPTRCLFSRNDQSNLIYKEYKRMKFDSKIWRLSDINRNFEICPSYPETVIIPVGMTEDQIKKIASFRGSKRFPAVVWRSKSNGAVLARSSQPNVGLLGWRLNEDELLIKTIADSSCANNNKEIQNLQGSDKVADSIKTESTNTENSSPMLLIIDARFRSVALANRVKGGGYEYSEYYTNCEIQFMNLENIHVIRSSFQALRLLCQSINDNKTFYSQLENTKWLLHLSGIIKAACTVTNSIDRQAKSVLIHCSDGWDRTPQILALAKLMLDSFYRTINGFRILVEHDWLMFGHKFSQRNGHAADHNDINERCPVFLQWLDCVFQIQRQFPWAFEFNETFLLKLCYHSYSCLFGTFLCDSVIQRVNDHIEERTFSIWSYLNDKNKEIINYLYDDSFDEIIYPLGELVNMQLWTKLFCESEITHLVNRYDLQPAFNDSLETPITSGNFNILNGSSQQIDEDLDLDSNMSDLKLNIHSNSSLSLKSINTSHNTINPNHLLRNFDIKKATDNKNLQLAITSGIKISQQHKTRSFEDLSISIKDTFKRTNLMDESQHNTNNMSIDGNSLNNLSASDFPISIRSCSESNLLLDALQTITSTSPKQTYQITGFLKESSILNNPIKNELKNTNNDEIDKYTNDKKDLEVNSCSHFDVEDKTPDKEEEKVMQPILEDFEMNDKKVDFINESFDLTDSINITGDLTQHNQIKQVSNGFLLNKINLENTESSENDNQNKNAMVTISNLTLTNSSSSLLRMQDSTDTLVDEANLVNKKKIIESKSSCSNATQTNGENINLNILDEVFEMNNKKPSNNINNKDKTSDLLGNAINNLTLSTLIHQSSVESSSTPLSSSIPSPDTSMLNSYNHNLVNKPNITKNDPVSINNSVSTSTSSLSDYVTSAKVRYINDTIKCFEKNFNEENSTSNHHNTKSNINGHFNGHFNNRHVMNGMNGNFVPNNRSNSDYVRSSRLKSNDKLNASGVSSSNGNKRIASKSIPIVRKSGEEKKKKKKTIQDCIDIDGLTKIVDKSCRKIVERDDQYKKEIANLKDQVNKCKSFLNTLTTNSMWQDSSNSFLKSEFLNDKSQIDENPSNSYSFSNDSVCSSSWDEIDESDYRLAPWVPDYYVTHCQGCNNKFSYRLRKHHCRNCGQVFCYQCADQFYPLPNHNLTAPARVCKKCMLTIEEKKNANRHNASTNNNQHVKESNSNSPLSSSSGITSFLSNPIKYDPYKSHSSSSTLNQHNNSKKVLIQNQQGFYINALNNGNGNSSNGNSSNGNTQNSSLQNLTSSSSNQSLNLNQRCNQYDSTNEFIEKNGNKTQKVSV